MSLRDQPSGSPSLAGRYDSPFLDEMPSVPEGEAEWRAPEPAFESEPPFAPAGEEEQGDPEAFISEGGFGPVQQGPPWAVPPSQGEAESGSPVSEPGAAYEQDSPFSYNEAEWEETLAASCDEAAGGEGEAPS